MQRAPSLTFVAPHTPRPKSNIGPPPSRAPVQVGPWVLSQMVGTTPVIMGRKLATTYHLTGMSNSRSSIAVHNPLLLLCAHHATCHIYDCCNISLGPSIA